MPSVFLNLQEKDHIVIRTDAEVKGLDSRSGLAQKPSI